MERRTHLISLNPYLTIWSATAALLCLTLLGLACGSASTSIVFTSDRDGNLEIYAVDPSGAKEANLTGTSDDESAPVVSPNGKMVAFRSRSPSKSSVEVMRLDGSARTPISVGSGVHRSQRWSGNSKRIAYVMEADPGATVFVADVDEPDPIPLTSVIADEVGDWSGDGSRVVFAVRDGPARGLWVRNPDGVNEVRLTDTPDHSAVWSPRSDKIAFISERDGNAEVYLMDAEGTDQTRITETEAAEYDLDWSPNGKRLLFISERDGNAEVYVLEMDGNEQTRLTQNSAKDAQPRWSPNGKRIVFVSYLDGDGEIFVMEDDGADQVRLTNNDHEDTDPSW